jgi:hypothetical protein
MRFLRFLCCLAALVVGGVLLGACGGDEGSSELRSGDATSLRSTLTEVEQRVEGRDCTGASEQAAAFREQVSRLSERVGSELRQALVSSADRLESLVANQCAAAPAAPVDVPAEPDTGTTSEDPAQGNDEHQPDEGTKDKKPKKEKPNQDGTQTQPDTGGAGEEVPGVGNQGDGTSPGE